MTEFFFQLQSKKIKITKDKREQKLQKLSFSKYTYSDTMRAQARNHSYF